MKQYPNNAAGSRIIDGRNTAQPKSESGFTIVELLIATTIFTVILLVTLSVFLQISKLYYKGITISRTQETARTILDDITQEIQYSSSPVVKVGAVGSNNLRFCVGSTRYSYSLNTQKSADPVGQQAKYVFQKDSTATNGSCPTPSPDGDGRISGSTEMLGSGMSITDLDVNCSGDNGICSVRLRIVNGNPADDGLFMDDNGKRVCRGSAIGTQFCSVVELNTSVTRRLL